MSEGTTVQPCTCEHKAQDEMYGKNMRVHNVSPPKGGSLAFCTVCAPNKQLYRNATKLDPIPFIGFAGLPARPPRIGKTPKF